MVSTRVLISNSSNPFTNSLVTVPSALITIGITVTFNVLINLWNMKVAVFIIILHLAIFLHQRKLMIFHWNLSDSKSPQVFRTLLYILANLKNTVVCMVSILPLISHSANLFSNPWGFVTRAPTVIGITVTFMFPDFFKYFSIFSFSFIFSLGSAWRAKSIRWQVLFSC